MWKPQSIKIHQVGSALLLLGIAAVVAKAVKKILHYRRERAQAIEKLSS